MSRPWVCLLYHDVLDRLPPLNGGPEWFAVSTRAFEEQLDVVRSAGYRGCSLGEALRDRTGRKLVAFSFDDGTAGHYWRAYRALAARDMTGTFFITTAWVGRPGHVTWEQLREMKAAGMSIQSHTHTHPILSELGAKELKDELERSKAELDAALGQDTDTIALPQGDRPRSRLWHLFADAGYRVVATSHWGVNRVAAPRDDEPLRVHRCTVKGAPPLSYYRRVLAGDRRVGLRRWLRERSLGGIRAVLGTSRYLTVRRHVLDLIGGSSASKLGRE